MLPREAATPALSPQKRDGSRTSLGPGEALAAAGVRPVPRGGIGRFLLPLTRAVRRARGIQPRRPESLLYSSFTSGPFPRRDYLRGQSRTTQDHQASHEGSCLNFTYSSLITIRFSSVPLVLTQNPVRSPAPGSRGADVFVKCLRGRERAQCCGEVGRTEIPLPSE